MAGNADPWVLLFEILGLALLLAPGPHPPQRLLLAGLLFAGAVCAKVEGLPFFAAAVLLFIVFDGSASSLIGKLGLLLAPSVVSLGAWFLFGLSRRSSRAMASTEAFSSCAGTVSGSSCPRLDAPSGARASPSPTSCLWPCSSSPEAACAASRLPSPRPMAAFLAATYMLPVRDPVSWIGWSAAGTFSPVAALLALALGPPEPEEVRDGAEQREPEIQSPATKTGAGSGVRRGACRPGPRMRGMPGCTREAVAPRRRRSGADRAAGHRRRDQSAFSRASISTSILYVAE